MLEAALILKIAVMYLCGSIPTGLLLTRLLLKKDLRTIGSGNIGTTNAFRTGSKLIGMLTLLGDIAKIALPLWILTDFFSSIDQSYLLQQNTAVLLGVVGVIGQLFPVWLKFKGGKGVASALGVLICLFPWSIIIVLPTYIITLWATRISSLSSLVGVSVSMIYAYFSSLPEAYVAKIAYFVMVILIFIRHKDNIVRLIQRTETKITRSK